MSAKVRGLGRSRKAATLKRVLRNDFNKVKLIKRLEGDEGGNQVMSCGGMAQTTGTAKTKALRQAHVCLV